MERVRVVGAGPEGVGDEVPQKPKQNMKSVYNFLTFSCKKLWFNEYVGAELGLYIL